MPMANDLLPLQQVPDHLWISPGHAKVKLTTRASTAVGGALPKLVGQVTLEGRPTQWLYSTGGPVPTLSRQGALRGEGTELLVHEPKGNRKRLNKGFDGSRIKRSDSYTAEQNKTGY